MLILAELIGGLLIIFLAAELFTNAVEWFGKKMKFNEGVVGSILAAVGTALPEASVALVAIASGGAKHTEAGIGAILGAPMMLSTLAMFMTGVAVLVFAGMGRRKLTIQADYEVVGRDLRSFFSVYVLALVAAVLPSRIYKFPIGLFLLGAYIYYVYRTFKAPDSGSDKEEVRPLHFHRRASSPRLRLVLLQLICGLSLMLYGARTFVVAVTLASKSLGVSTLVLSLIITPIATELPEKFNSITWILHRKDTLALGNITGAMVFQSSILPAVGIFATPWHLDAQALGSIVVALLASFVAWAEMTIRKRLSPFSLLAGGFFYLLYPVFVFVVLPRI
ncbi:MAG: sodium:calcium antiporter [Armatimonadota bacterium]